MNMPHGGYKMVSNRLSGKDYAINNAEILDHVRRLKKEKDENFTVILECLKLMEENNVPLDAHCTDFIENFSEKKKER